MNRLNPRKQRGDDRARNPAEKEKPWLTATHTTVRETSRPPASGNTALRTMDRRRISISARLRICTPSPLPREREERSQHLSLIPSSAITSKTGRNILPLPQGEGGVRGKGAYELTAAQKLR